MMHLTFLPLVFMFIWVSADTYVHLYNHKDPWGFCPRLDAHRSW